MNHVALPSSQEIVGAYQALNAFAGVPKSELKGFRFPFLNYTTDTVASVANSKLFQYESSMPVDDSVKYSH